MPTKNQINNSNHFAVNGGDTYSWIARAIKRNGRCLVGWSDGESNYDLLFAFDRQGMQKAGKINPKIDSRYLFVAVMGVGAFAIEINNLVLSPSIVGERLGVLGAFSEKQFYKKLAELVGEVKVRL